MKDSEQEVKFLGLTIRRTTSRLKEVGDVPTC